ncbi:CRP/FNR family transcriptional regulator [Thermovibrio guaymasensis]|uniref:CRP/FNR family transcriptional regulator n=1 Tax=Thermovibrio guaymasensis TaxID=240167 RepID=A0A420W6G9_9BACT|nr:Crp/Fnr family transcriptional regulator [Thermovibrio guaymasensis]RKQ61683.1 CRP/FNR family transcriptional regulator [Thermovibrio guaymasensis]
MELLREVPLFSELSQEQIKEITSISLVKKYTKNQTIFSPFQKGEYFFILKRGKVKVYKTSRDKEQIIRIFDKPTMFGEAASFTGKNFPAWAEAIEDSEVILIPRRDFLSLIKRDPEIGMKLMSVMAQRLVYLTNVIESLSLKNALSKISLYILRKSEEEGQEVEFSTNLAAMELGLTKETVSRMLSKLKEMGIIEKDRNRIKIKKPQALRELSL